MEEFIFGTLATDELKLVHHRAARSGLQHGHELMPRDPVPGLPVTISVCSGPDLAADHVACYYTTDGSEPAGNRGVASRGAAVMLNRSEVAWDTLVWGYIDAWQGAIPAQPEGVIVRYRIGAWADGGPETFADWPDVKARAEEAAAAFFHGRPLLEVRPGDPTPGRTFAYGVDRLGQPDWVRETVIYQIFVDRFFPGQGRNWIQTADLRGFCGGTLWGIEEKLDYVSDLGADCLWLTPIFCSPTNHGYDVTDLYHVEPRLGGDEALHSLVEEAHRRGIRVLLDFVCNHISSQHPIFQDAASSTSSPYRNWFTFDDSEIGYRTFFGVAKMPQVNVAYPEARRWMIDAARYWLREFDVDGYRLDHANGPGPDFWIDFWTACKAEKPDCYCFGEVVEAPAVLRTYAGTLDGCLDFHGADALRRTFALGRWTESHLEEFLARHQAFFPADFSMPTFLDNHDMDRFLHLASGNKQALRRAATLQMRLPGPPIIYYGTEVGLSQRTSIDGARGMHVNRVPMDWGADQDGELLDFYRALVHERRKRA